MIYAIFALLASFAAGFIFRGAVHESKRLNAWEDGYDAGHNDALAGENIDRREVSAAFGEWKEIEK